jgi:hypothetical protein
MQGFLKPKHILPRLSALLLASALAVLLGFGLFGHSSAASNHRTVQGPVGSWLVTLITTSGPPTPPFQGLYTYGVGGDAVETDQLDFNPKSLVSPEHGAWESKEGNQFVVHLIDFHFDSKGNPAGTLQEQITSTISADGNTYTGSGTFQRFDANGKLIASASGSEIVRAKRIHAES